jgi:hypothetical protein
MDENGYLRPLLGHSGHGRCIVPIIYDAIDPNVWSGRALQEDFSEWGTCGLASMYPAFAWSLLCPGPSWISARLRSH